MTRFFISQPMAGLTDEEVKAERKRCTAWLARAFGGGEVIDTFFLDEPPKGCKNVGLWYLGKSLEALAKADVLVQWGDCYEGRGCLVEQYAAQLYGIPIIKKGGIDD